ncbi:MAG: hypothetical protein ACR2K1_08965 [Saprospiraceae bacterium]
MRDVQEELHSAVSIISGVTNDVRTGRDDAALRKIESARAVLANAAKILRGIQSTPRGTVREHATDFTGYHD